MWMEGDREFERIIPSNWLCDGFVRWPPSNNAKPYLKRRDQPTEQSKSFPLVKVKPQLQDRDARNRGEEDQMQDLLHAIRCDDYQCRTWSDLASMTVHLDSRHPDQLKSCWLRRNRETKYCCRQKPVWQHRVPESVHTTRPNSKATREKTGTGAAAKAQEGTRRSKPDHSPRQDRSQTAETTTGRAAGSGSLRCLYTNANSIVNKMSELHERVIVEDFELIGIAETWATESVNDAELSIVGYNSFERIENLEEVV